MNFRRPFRQDQGWRSIIGQGWPISTPSTAPPALRRSHQSPNSLLLVADHDEEGLALKRTLRKAGITMPIRIAPDMATAKAYLQGDPPFSNRARYPLPSVVILHVHVPKKGGFDLLRWLRAQSQCRHIFVAVFVSPRKINDIAQAYRLGGNWFLTEPCRVEDIRNLIQNFPTYWSASPAQRV